MSINSTGTRVVPDSLSTAKTPLPSPKQEIPADTPGDGFHKTHSVPALAKPGKSIPKYAPPVAPSPENESRLIFMARSLMERFPKLGNDIHANLTMDSGLSHTLWGNKPMAWIGGNDKPLWRALKILVMAGFPLRENFILLDSNDLFPSKGTGFIINRRNLSNLLNDNPHLLDPWPKLKEYRSDKVIKTVFETINPVSRQLLTNNESLGTLLGYGLNNASKWSRMQADYAPPKHEPDLPKNSMLYEEMQKTPEELQQERSTSKISQIADEICDSDTSPYKVYLPGFVAFDSSPETPTLITRYLEDCWRIRDHLKEQHQMERLASGENSQTSYRNFLTRLVLRNLFQFGPEPLPPRYDHRNS